LGNLGNLGRLGQNDHKSNIGVGPSKVKQARLLSSPFFSLAALLPAALSPPSALHPFTALGLSHCRPPFYCPPYASSALSQPSTPCFSRALSHLAPFHKPLQSHRPLPFHSAPPAPSFTVLLRSLTALCPLTVLRPLLPSALLLSRPSSLCSLPALHLFTALGPSHCAFLVCLAGVPFCCAFLTCLPGVPFKPQIHL
jgi:hypothetical protein